MARRDGGLVKHLALHLHVYQPPRENPWTDAIERQPTAAPYHDWNERISEECYEKLGAVPLRRDGRVVRLVNLFDHVSFNIGPTLASWLATERPAVMEDAARGDGDAHAASGHGNALMQAFGHAILPLCDERERRLQIAWGRADFRARFGREPSGIWLPECAVDRPTLETCSALGLTFTVVAPEQVASVRPRAGGEWREVPGGSTPTDRPLAVELAGGAEFLVFPFHGSLSRGVAFDGLLASTERLRESVRGAMNALPEAGGMALIAADGETYGHHQPGGEETLADLVDGVSRDPDVSLASLERLSNELPATHLARLVEPSAWSCAHGVGRWERACGCAARPRREGWSFEWRSHLRKAVTRLRERCFELVDSRGGELVAEPWVAAEAYGDVLARGADETGLDDWFSRHRAAPRDDTSRRRAAALMELVRHTLSAATSCGWFFDDLARIEGVQVLRHAARAADLARGLFGVDPDPELLAILGEARSNAARAGSGAQVYRQRALPARRSLGDAVAIHAARRLAGTASGDAAAGASSSQVGTIRVEDFETGEVRHDRNGRVTVEGRARARHARTLDALEAGYRIALTRLDRPIGILVDGHRPRVLPPPVREELLRAGETLFAAASDVPPALDWMGRTARAFRIPSALGDTARSAALARVQAALQGPADDPEPDASLLARALRRARAAGLTRDELAALRGPIGRRLAELAGRALDDDDERAVAQIARACRAARSMLGEAALFALRRTVVRRRRDHHRAAVMRLADAAGLAPDALVPSDTPARTPGGDGTATV